MKVEMKKNKLKNYEDETKEGDDVKCEGFDLVKKAVKKTLRNIV